MDAYPNQPFAVVTNGEEYNALKSSVRANGILVPLIVRRKEGGRFEIISGHRRKAIAEELDLKAVPCIIKDIGDEDALLYLIDANLQREHLTLSEKVTSVTLKYNILLRRREGVYTKEGRTRDIVAEEMGMSPASISQYVSLNSLGRPILTLIDDGLLKREHALKWIVKFTPETRERIRESAYDRYAFDNELFSRLPDAEKAGLLSGERYAEMLCEYKEECQAKKDASKQSVKMSISKRILNYYPGKSDSDIPKQLLSDLARIYELVPDGISLTDKNSPLHYTFISLYL